MRTIVFFIISLLIPALLIGFVNRTNAPEYRMAYLQCPAELIHYTEGKTDYLVAGTSRVLMGISAEVMSSTLAESDNAETPPIVISLGRSWKGNGQTYHMFRDYLENHTVEKAFLLELSYVSYDDSRSQLYYNGYYPNYPLVTDTKDFWDDIKAAPREPFYISLHNYFNLLVKQVSQRFDQIHSKRPKLKSTTIKPLTESKDCRVRENRLKPHIHKARDRSIERRFKGDWRNKPLRIGDPHVINNDRPVYFIKKINELAEKHGAEFYLFMVPQYMGGLPKPETIREAEEAYGVKILIPSEDVLEKLYDKANYADNSHMTAAGREILSTWLAQQISDNAK